MLSIVLLFGLIDTISGNNTTILPSSNSIHVGVTLESGSSNVTNIYFSTITSAVFSNTPVINQTAGSVPSTSASAPFSTSIATKNTTTITQFLSPVTSTPGTVSEISGILKDNNKGSTIISSSMTTSSTRAPHKTLQKTISVTPTTFSPSTFAGKSSQRVTFISSSRTSLATTPTATGKTTKTTEKKTNKEKVFWWHVTTGTLKYMFYGTAVVATLCIILLIIVCCCWRRQTRTLKKRQRQDTTLSNRYINNRVVGFPSPLQLDTFIIKPESPYDTPELVETLPEDVEVSYVTVIDGNESDSHYAAVKVNGTANSIADSESRGDDPPHSPAYTNASVFEMDPYQELMPANRSNEDHYTSLINRDENEENEEDEVTI